MPKPKDMRTWAHYETIKKGPKAAKDIVTCTACREITFQASTTRMRAHLLHCAGIPEEEKMKLALWNGSNYGGGDKACKYQIENEFSLNV